MEAWERNIAGAAQGVVRVLAKTRGLLRPLENARGFVRTLSGVPGRVRHRSRAERWVTRLAFVLLFAGAVAFELQTATLQSFAVRSFVSTLVWQLVPGASPRVIFPRWGPFDERLGYTRIPEFRRRLEAHGYRIAGQARISKSLAAIARMGLTPPQVDRPAAGLVIRARDGTVLYDGAATHFRFARFEQIPPRVVAALALMEDHGLDTGAHANPAVDWGRLSRAAVFSLGSKLGLPLTFQGGSTVEVQIEKYRHSRDGRTRSAMEKIQQIVSASLRAYGSGARARDEQRAIVLDYLNTVPLGGAPGYGEVHGIGEGLRAWFGLDPDRTFAALADTAHTSLRAQARAWKPVLALLCAVRAPSRMLRTDHADLARRVAFYQNRMVALGLLGPKLAHGMDKVSLAFVPKAPYPAVPPEQRDIVERVRLKLPGLLGVRDLHELDGLDLEVETTYDASLQARALEILHSLKDPDTVAAHGLNGPHMLDAGDPSGVSYSLLLCERGENTDLVSVVADDRDRAFDMNTGMRMQLGSTAKLRTMAHYLEIVERLHHDLSALPHDAVAARAAEARDPITAWAATEMAKDPELPLDSLLSRALDREYSANPGEVFFTGGGVHTFHNFEPEDDGRHPDLRDAFANSINLVFIRLMRDIVRYHSARLPYDAQAVLADSTNVSEQRRKMLIEASNLESQVVLQRSWKNLSAVPVDSIPERLVGARRSPQRMAMLFFAWHHAAPAESLASWLGARGFPVDTAEAGHLTRAYGGDALTTRDYAYLLDLHPLDLWTGHMLTTVPGLPWKDLLAASGPAREEAQQWLFEPRNRRAQDLRLRILIERDAFADMYKDWKRLGFPFDHLVPSYATAIGSSADRPAALAELMGIIVNDGVKRDALTIRKIRFAPGTPYETVLEPVSEPEERLLSVPVTRALRGILAGVVDHGTARSLAAAFPDSVRARIPIGGKTGSGDNRFEVFGRGGRLISSRAVNRTAIFVFYFGDRYYGTLTAAVDGPQSGSYTFTSMLPVHIVRLLAPELERRVAPELAPHGTTEAERTAARADSARIPDDRLSASIRGHGGSGGARGAAGLRGF